jgi:hypothetical protein
LDIKLNGLKSDQCLNVLRPERARLDSVYPNELTP